MELKLVVAVGEPKGKEISLSKSRTVIGRKPECDVVIASPKVSREHCRIDISGDSATIVDLGSRNGIYVNGQKTKQSRLKSGDKVAIGPLGFVVSTGAAKAAKAAAADEDDVLTLTEEAGSDMSEDINDFLAQLEKRGGGSSISDDDIIQLNDDKK